MKAKGVLEVVLILYFYSYTLAWRILSCPATTWSHCLLQGSADLTHAGTDGTCVCGSPRKGSLEGTLWLSNRYLPTKETVPTSSVGEGGFQQSLPSAINLDPSAVRWTSYLRWLKVNRNIKSAALCALQTWLWQDVPDNNICVAGFTTIRADRDFSSCEKKKGSGLSVWPRCGAFSRWTAPILTAQGILTALL